MKIGKVNHFESGCVMIQIHHSNKVANTTSGVPRNFFRGGVSTNSVEDRKNRDLGAVVP